MNVSKKIRDKDLRASARIVRCIHVTQSNNDYSKICNMDSLRGFPKCKEHLTKEDILFREDRRVKYLMEQIYELEKRFREFSSRHLSARCDRRN